MDQENSFIEEINENDLKNEWLKKGLVVLVTVAVLGGTYYFTGINGKKTKVTAVNTEQINVKPENTKELSSKDFKVVRSKNESIKINKQDQVLISENYKQPENKAFSGIRPTDKTSVARAALIAAGKPDPFSGSSSEKTELQSKLKTFLPKYIGKNPPIFPPSLKGLPNIDNLPSLNLPNSNLLPGKAPLSAFQSDPEVKGFIGDKVILSMNGMNESLKENESFQGIKVVKVDSKAMTVKLIQNKKVITKNISK
jgi:hypothetical protein